MFSYNKFENDHNDLLKIFLSAQLSAKKLNSQIEKQCSNYNSEDGDKKYTGMTINTSYYLITRIDSGEPENK